MSDLIQEVKAALQLATPGPWTMLDGRIYGKTMTAVEPLIHEFDDESIREVRNAHLILHSPTWLQQLIYRVEELEEELIQERSGREAKSEMGSVNP